MQTEKVEFALLVRAKRRAVKEKPMKKKPDKTGNDDLRTEYDASLIRNGARGKYAARYEAGTNLVLLAPDVAAAFPDPETVNEALRLLMKVAKTSCPG